MQPLDSSNFPGYKTAHIGAVFYQHTDGGYLRIEGPDRLDFLQRQTTNDEAGLPAAGAELTGDYTPLEAGLNSAISDTKGCYTGQEVIARQITYAKITRHLVGLSLDTLPKTGERVWVEAKPIGTLTSSVLSPTYGPIALAYPKRPHHQPGSRVWVGETRESEGASGVVTPLPFS